MRLSSCLITVSAGLIGPEWSHTTDSNRNCPHRIVVDVELNVDEALSFDRQDLAASDLLGQPCPVECQRMDLWTFESNSPGRYVEETTWRVRDINGACQGRVV